MKETKKAKIWIYAVILFTSAFIVLVITAFSQIKLNNNLDDIKNQAYNKETEKNKYQQKFSSAQEMNTKLNEEIMRLQEENNILHDAISDIKNEQENISAAIKKKNEANEGLFNALTLYLNRNVVESAALLKNIDAEKLDIKADEAYKALKLKVNAEAGKLLFNEGYTLYRTAHYTEAAEKLLLSSQYAPSETFSDKCLFYLSYAEFKSGNTTAALEHMEQLIRLYSSSKYRKSAKQFIAKHK